MCARIIHTALPGSIEAYYQEIGRAGRDGKPSRTILMHSWADRKTHDFFFERDYPEVSVLDGIFKLLSGEPQEKAALERRSRLGSEAFDKALEKLWIHGGATIDFAENVTAGHDRWRETYEAQANQKRQQIDLILRYAESNECRMAALVRHFGDLAGARQPCGICDFCAPADCVGQQFRAATADETACAAQVLAALRRGPKSSGRLHTELHAEGGMTRDAFEELLGGMARAGLIRLADATFEKDGRTIPFRKVYLLEEREQFEIRMKVNIEAPAGRGRRRKRRATAKGAGAGKTAKPAKSAPRSDIESALRNWRLAEAKRRGVPAFRVFTDRTLEAMVSARPATVEGLLSIPGIGIGTVQKYGAQLYRLLQAGPPE